MVNWNSFDIKDKYVNESSGYIKFDLDGYVSYSGGSEKYIYCKKTGPFTEWKEEDSVQIDFEKTRQHGSTYDFTFYDNAIYKYWTSNPELSKVRSDYYSLQSSHSSLQSRNSELCSDKSRLQSEIYSLQSQNSNLQSEISSLRVQNSAKDSQINTFRSQLSNLQSEVSSLRVQNSAKDNQIAILNSQSVNVQNQLKNKEGELLTTKKGLEELRGSFESLKIVDNDKSYELEKRERKVKELKELLGKSKEEIISYRLKTKEFRLETLIQKLKIDRGKIRELRSIYQKLARVGADDNSRDEIDKLEDEIEISKDELIDKGVDMIEVKKICQKCEKIAKLKAEQDKLYEERFEARQEIILHDRR